MADKKYYWLRLKRDFFKRHDIQIVENMSNGKDYILFYLKLLCESVDHEGNLRFSDEIPYSAEMLATITNTNVDIVRSAIEIFSKLGMIDVLDDGTYFMNEVQKMVGSATQDEHTRESTRLRVQKCREKKKLLQLDKPDDEDTKRYSNATCNGELEIELELEKDIYSDIDIKERDRGKPHTHTNDKPKRKVFTPPTVEEVKQYCQERNNNVDAETFVDFYECKGWMVGKNKMKDWKAAVRTWERKDNYGRPKTNTNKPTVTDHKDTKSAAMEIFGEF